MEKRKNKNHHPRKIQTTPQITLQSRSIITKAITTIETFVNSMLLVADDDIFCGLKQQEKQQ